MVRILVLGKSGAAGAGLEDPSRAWPYLLRDAVAAETGEPVELEVRSFYLIGTDPTDYLRKIVGECHPDIVVARVSANDFALVTVSNRVTSRWGARAARYVARTERKLRRPWSPGRPGMLDAIAQKIAHRLIGAEPRYTRAQVVYSAEALFRFLGQREEITGFIVACTPFSAWLQERNPGLDRVVDEFNRDMRIAAEARYLEWVAYGPRDSADFIRDGLHDSQSGHEKLVRDLLPQVCAAVRERTAAGVA